MLAVVSGLSSSESHRNQARRSTGAKSQAVHAQPATAIFSVIQITHALVISRHNARRVWLATSDGGKANRQRSHHIDPPIAVNRRRP
jgi:hypothetical protein